MQGITHLIADTGPFVLSAPLSQAGPDAQYFVTPEVVSELKDVTARRNFDTFPFKISVQQPTVSAVNFIKAFSRKTGDFSVLSVADINVLALAYEHELQVNGHKYLKVTAEEMHVAPVAPAKPTPKPSEPKILPSNPSSSIVKPGISWAAKMQQIREAQQAQASQSENQSQPLPVNVPNPNPSQPAPQNLSSSSEQPQSIEPATVQPAAAGLPKSEDSEESKDQEESADADSVADEPDEEGEWITPDNLHLQSDYRVLVLILT